MWYPAFNSTNAAATDEQKAGDSQQEIVHAAYRSLILRRKETIDRINFTGNKVPSTPITLDELVRVCTTMMSFDDDEKFKTLQVITSLKVVDYLLECECQ